jgi:hypothetical protein
MELGWGETEGSGVGRLVGLCWRRLIRALNFAQEGYRMGLSFPRGSPFEKGDRLSSKPTTRRI